MVAGIFMLITGAMGLFVLFLDEFNLIIFLLCIFLLVNGGLLIIINSVERKEEEDYKQMVDLSRQNLLKGFVNQKWTSDINDLLCVLDNKSKQINFWYLSKQSKTYENRKIYNYEDIIQVELLIDNETISKTVRGSQISGALVGGVLAGGVGAIIGGLSGSTSSKKTYSSIQLKLTLNDSNDPIIILNLFKANPPLPKEDINVVVAKKKAMRWQGYFEVILNNNKKYLSNSESELSKGSVSEEIRKLHDLWKDGIITEEEFNVKKSNLLGISSMD